LKRRRILRKDNLTSKDVAAFRRAANAYVERATASGRAANETLAAVGIYTQAGRLAKPYRR
jgi:hypothetical protein